MLLIVLLHILYPSIRYHNYLRNIGIFRGPTLFRQKVSFTHYFQILYQHILAIDVEIRTLNTRRIEKQRAFRRIKGFPKSVGLSS